MEILRNAYQYLYWTPACGLRFAYSCAIWNWTQWSPNRTNYAQLSISAAKHGMKHIGAIVIQRLAVGPALS